MNAPVGKPVEATESGSLLKNLRHDVPASLVVFLVALPLSLGIAIASGAPLAAGLIAAVVGGIVAGAFGGSSVQVSGPAAGLTVVVAGLIDELGFPMLCLMTVGAGALQIAFGLSRLARAALAIAPVVVHAMLAGIGITIILQQIHVLMGGSSHSSAWQNLVALPNGILHHELHEVITGGTVIAILLVWSRLPAKIRMIPAPLVAIVAATALAIAAGLDTDRISLSGNFFDALNLPHISGASPKGKPWIEEASDIIVGVLTIALIASVESLLCAVGADKLHTGPRTNFDREIIGQGTANVVSGLVGGLPITGVIVRSSANVAAGARTRMSAVLHGVWILLFASLFTDLVELIPKAALAGLLIVVGAQLIKLAHIKLAWRTGNFAVYAVTIVSVVFLNLLEGVIIGLAVAIGLLLVRVTRAPVAVRPIGGELSKQWRIDIDGTLSFLLLPRLTKALASVPQGSEVTLNLNADYIDDSVSETIGDWQRTHEARGGVVVIVETTGAKLQHAHARPPKRHFASNPIGLVPWRSQRANHGNNGDATILDRVDEYHRNGSAVLHQHIAGLGGTHDPYALFLTCADSRILPNVITASGPGDLYTVRNFGNLVPTDGDDRSVDAALEFAARQLGVRSVVICGHSSCAAMKVLLEDSDHPATSMGQWLEYAGESLDAYRDHHPARASAESVGYSEIDQLSIVNVAIQLERLIRHPILAPAVASGDIHVVGIFFDIASTRVYEVTPRGIVCPEEPVRPPA
ncbi:carbonic anhydrase [Mycobacterium florentinum]|uniref:carbonic anhydrase n=1 Tax=Mycobacterium florentinum TaxID=292462 RepID=A0A1X1UI88_MYCFL|nr:bifunctional SulP family inorganic anion transporter/carbonic anhydrase [Mycobacterium florentinum]MCV7409369.1 bifunctional SulP family inorganic anion transporter/carbonic anhydrase [Mycobacterium florentinum]ORV56544.1 carbonic anhydrase [Mycobacterium florentinum]BBX78433.1 carbonic anhydrase [Mycobacterium florentinum]